jgi:flagellar basal body rod protein FlgB
VSARGKRVHIRRNLADKAAMIDFSIPLAGLDRAASSLNQTASRLAAGPADTVDLSAEMVALLEARNSFETNTKVIQTEDQMTKSLLNLLG